MKGVLLRSEPNLRGFSSTWPDTRLSPFGQLWSLPNGCPMSEIGRICGRPPDDRTFGSVAAGSPIGLHECQEYSIQKAAFAIMPRNYRQCLRQAGEREVLFQLPDRTLFQA